MNRRIGKFSISADFVLSYSSIAKRIFGMCTILRAEHQVWENRFEYVAICDKFEIVPEGAICFEYSINIKDGEPEFIKETRT